MLSYDEYKAIVNFSVSILRKAYIQVLVVSVTAFASGVLTNYSVLYGKAFKVISYSIGENYSKLVRAQNISEIRVKAVSRQFSSAVQRPGSFESNISLGTSDTAVIVMDAWHNSKPYTFNQIREEAVVQTRLIPLVQLFMERGYKVYFATNKCEKGLTTMCGINKGFSGSEDFEKVYHQYATTSSFSNKLLSNGISKLVYVGFASNQCLLGSRHVSMIPMHNAYPRYEIYYIPQASSAIETDDTFSSQLIHKATTLTISQWVASILDYDDVVSSLGAVTKG